MNEIKRFRTKENEEIKRFRIAENMGGHDGAANGGHYGGYDVLFGIFPDGAVVVGGEKPGAVHTRQTGNRLNYHRDSYELWYSVDESRLGPGDFIAIEHRHNGLVYNSSGGDIKILAHRLPIGDIPDSWEPVGGSESSYSNGYSEATSWSFIRTSDGSQITFEEAVKELGLIEMRHPFGKLWLAGDKPVAITEMPTWSSGRENRGFKNSVISGSRKFFTAKGLAVLEHNHKNTYYGAGDYYSCSQEVVLRGIDIANLREDGWYPIKVKEYFVLWGTGLYLYPKHLTWQIGLDPAHGTTEDKRGTRIFDSSRNRLDRVREFFREAVGVAVGDPEAEYIRWANNSDPRGGKWRHKYHYPASWIPHFSGWPISRFGEVECRWKQPKSGTARFYGLARK